MPNYSGIWTEQAVMQAVGAGNWPGVPGAPTIGTATGGDASASVTFTAPTNNGGSAITSYTVTSSPGSLTGTGASSPVTVSGLTNGTAYTFTVTATNATGTGPASAASNSVTPAAPNYVEQVFSTWLYAGNGSTQTITNGIDLSGKGGLVWQKTRSVGTTNHVLCDTARGVNAFLFSNDTLSSINNGGTDAVYSYNANGFSTGTVNGADINLSGETAVSWTFRKQPKFFDVVTWTGTGSNTTISHSLGSVPACIMVKRTDTTSNWQVYHRSLANTEYLVLNTTAAKATGATRWNSTTPTSTVFSLGTDATVNASGGTYVAYIFAHNAGGFGTSGNDNVISCGSYSGNGSSDGPIIDLGYEPQWLLIKRASGAANWELYDTMRGFTNGGIDATLFPNLADAENAGNAGVLRPLATGFQLTSTSITRNGSGNTYIYIAIRRGPMAVPTDATKVYTPVLNSDFTDGVVIPGQPTVDVSWSKGTSANQMRIFDRLRGATASIVWTLYPDSSGSQGNEAYWGLDQQNGVRITSTIGTIPYVNYFFSRAAGFFDEVCFTVSGSVPLRHNLTVRPELVIYKTRTTTDSWWTCADVNGVGQIESNGAFVFTGSGNGLTNFAQATSTTISNLNGVLLSSGNNVVAYLFATVAGVSKVGLYTGTGAAQTINCGFAAGVRFVLIKRTDSTGDWYLFNSASGITSGNDPYILLNSAAAQVTGTNYINTTAVGFDITGTAPAAINANGGTFLFLAIA